MTEIPEAHDHRGAQVWDGSKAQQFLRQDMADGKYDDGRRHETQGSVAVQHTKRVLLGVSSLFVGWGIITVNQSTLTVSYLCL